MRITIVFPTANLSGGARVVATYAKKLSQRDHQVALFSVSPEPVSLRHRLRALRRGEPQPKKQNRGFSHFDGSGIQHTVIKHRPILDTDLPDADVVIATWWETAEWVDSLSSSKGVKVYLVQHHEIHQHLPVERVRASYRFPMHKIVVAPWLAEVMHKEYGDSNVSCVLNSVDTEQFNAPPRCKQRPPAVGIMYAEVAFKGCEIGLKAYSLARERFPSLRLVTFGAFQPSHKLSLPKGTEFVFRPTQNRIKDIYSSCDAWMIPSRFEGFGLPILEAMACRTPVIATPTGAAPELLSNGAGILVKFDDPDDIARAIVKVAKMRESQWRTMSERAYEVAKAYTWDDATDQFEQALHLAVERARKGEIAGKPLSLNMGKGRIAIT